MSPSGLKGNGLLGWSGATSITTRCRETCSALTVFGQLSAAYGDKLSSGAASVTDSSGHALVVSQTSTYRSPELHIPIRRNASRHVPEAGAVCGSSARTDLCGGWQATAIPTATDLDIQLDQGGQAVDGFPEVDGLGVEIDFFDFRVGTHHDHGLQNQSGAQYRRGSRLFVGGVYGAVTN